MCTDPRFALKDSVQGLHQGKGGPSLQGAHCRDVVKQYDD
jgi:hypothetical protein